MLQKITKKNEKKICRFGAEILKDSVSKPADGYRCPARADKNISPNPHDPVREVDIHFRLHTFCRNIFHPNVTVTVFLWSGALSGGLESPYIPSVFQLLQIRTTALPVCVFKIKHAP